MNFGEQFVAAALQSLGYFVIEGLKVGVREADFLAIRVLRGRPEFYHIEVQISYNPIGVLRARAAFGRTTNFPEKAAKEFIGKKFFQESLTESIRDCFGIKEYKKLFIHGRLRNPEQLRVFKKYEIECLSIKDLAQAADKSHKKTIAFINFYDISKIIHTVQE